jgi:hypothetical protein
MSVVGTMKGFGMTPVTHSEPASGEPSGAQDDLGRSRTESRSTGEKYASEARQQGKKAVDRAAERARSLASEQKSLMAEELTGIAEAVRAGAGRLNEQDRVGIARYAERAANSLESMSDAVRRKDLAMLVNDVEGFARRQPGIFVGGAVAAGFLLARFLRSSSERGESGTVYSGGVGSPGAHSAGTYSQGQRAGYGATSQTGIGSDPAPSGPDRPGSATDMRGQGG